MVYDEQFYATVRDGVRASAAAVVPVVLSQLTLPTIPRVIDVGCGEGWWAQVFAERGCDVVGVDLPRADHPQAAQFVAADADITVTDLALAFGHFDLAVCLEVGEHLPAAAAPGLVANLCALAPVVLFSAAIPGQGGTGHIHEQWPAYWVDLFEGHGYSVSGALRWLIWNDPAVDNWYRQNTLIAAASPQDHPAVFDTPLAPPWPVVHPVLYDARRQH